MAMCFIDILIRIVDMICINNYIPFCNECIDKQRRPTLYATTVVFRMDMYCSNNFKYKINLNEIVIMLLRKGRLL